ncbi:MAG TPA: glycosyltransferase family 39 protein [Terriglobales bacterium]|nr:glycosyltransferase family 39 protein [Terriglobales bacterium]
MPLPETLEPRIAGPPQARSERLLAFYPWLVVGFLTIIAALLRFHAIGAKNIWADEAVCIEMARLDWYNFLRILWRHEANMVLYTAMLRAWLLFGSSEAYIRTLSVLPALATIPAVYVLGRKMFNARVGMIAAFLLTINAYHVRYAQEARSYSLYPLLCVLSSIYFLRFLETPDRKNRIEHVLTSTLAVYAHFYAGLLVVVQWLSLRLLNRKELEPAMKKNWCQFAIAITPLILFVATTGVGMLRWLPKPHLIDLHICGLVLTGNGGDRLMYAYLAVCVVGILPAFRGLLQLRVEFDQWRYRYLLLWLLFPILFIWVISQIKPFFLGRYFIFTLPALVLLAAAGIDRLRSRWLIGPALLLFLAWSLPPVYAFYQKDFDIGREDFRTATAYILSHAQPGDAILFHQPIDRMPYEYYCSRIAANTYPRVIYPEHGEKLKYKDFYAGHAADAFLETVPESYRRVWVVLAYNTTPSGPDATTKFIDKLFGKQYANVERKSFTGIDVRLYSRP